VLDFVDNFFMKTVSESKIIALLTDFGTRDYFVGAMKGVILSISRNTTVVDITHDIEPQNIESANFTLRACYREFPPKTIFVAVVDPGVGSDRRAILVETEKYYFLAPDNGLLGFVFDEAANHCVYELTDEKYFRRPVSHTFHGRDIFAACAAHLSIGIEPNEFGSGISDFVRLRENFPRKTNENEIEAQIIHVDRFGNLVTNLKRTDLPEKFILEIGDNKIEILRSFYAEAEADELFMIFGSSEYLEVVAFRNSAAKLLDAKIGEGVRVHKT
jgi:S-adenosylmethionine hydrolase